MPFTNDTFAHLFDWEKDPQRQEKIVNARLEAEFDGIDTALSTVKAANAALVAPQYVVAAAAGDLANERVLTDTATVTWDFSVAGQAKANAAAGRELLTGNRTYYVRTDGNDGNAGLVNNAGGAFLTIQKAVDTAAALDSSIYNVTVQIADGTYTGATVLKKLLGSGYLFIKGNLSTPANVLISTTSASCFAAGSIGGLFYLQGMKLQATTSGYGLLSTIPNVIFFDTMDFGAVPAGHAHIYNSASYVTSGGNYTVSGGGGYHILCGEMGYTNIAGRTITVSGTPAFGNAFAAAQNSALLFAPGITFSGSATGPRFSATSNGTIFTGGGGASYFPGNAGGTESTPDLYS
jgi:hypothetical protein